MRLVRTFHTRSADLWHGAYASFTVGGMGIVDFANELVEEILAQSASNRIAANLDDSLAKIAYKGCRRGLQQFSHGTVSKRNPKSPA